MTDMPPFITALGDQTSAEIHKGINLTAALLLNVPPSKDNYIAILNAFTADFIEVFTAAIIKVVSDD